MTRVPIAIVAFALLCVVSTPVVANAQFPESVRSGTRVRVWIPEAHLQEQGPWRRQQLRGTVASVTTDTLHVRVPGTGGTLLIARQSLRRLDISRGRPSRAASAFERAFAMAVVAAISVSLDNDPRGSEWPHYSRGWRAAEQGAKWGAALGAAVGFLWPTERWRRARLN